MSIVINGMDMPKGNSTKNLLIYSDGRVFTGHKDDANYSAEERKTGKWIPVTERLPEAYAEVLVWFEYFRYGNYNCLYQTYGIGSHDDNFNVWLINHETGWDKLRVIAWMPLPESYNAERRTDGEETDRKTNHFKTVDIYL